MNKRSAQLQNLEALRRQVSAIENERTVVNSDLVSGGAAVIDRILPAGGYRRGVLIDWIASTGCAADFLSMLVAKEAARQGDAVVIIDPDRQFFPVAAAAMGLPMEQLVVLQSSAEQHAGSIDQDLLWAIDQSLRCPAVAAVWGPLPKVDDRWSRRFQLSAESSGCLGLFVRPLSVARQPSWAEVQWLVSPAARVQGADPNLFFSRVQMVRCRGSHTGQSALLSINTVTGSVRKARSEHEYRRSTQPSRPQPSRKHRAGSQNNSPAPFIAHSISTTQTHPVPVATGVADSTADRRRA